MAEQTIRLTYITTATEKDITALDMLVNGAYRGNNSKKGWTTEADLLDGLRTDPDSLLKLIQDPDAAILKYTNEDGHIQGCVYLKKKQNKFMVFNDKIILFTTIVIHS